MASIECSVCTTPAGCSETKHAVGWEGSRRLFLLDRYACRVGEALSTSPASVRVTAEQIDKEISRFTHILVDVATTGPYLASFIRGGKVERMNK